MLTTSYFFGVGGVELLLQNYFYEVRVLLSDLMSYDDSTDFEILRSGHRRVIRLSVRPSGKLKNTEY